MAEQQQMGPDGWERGAPKPPVVDKVEPKTPSPMTPKVMGRPPKNRNRNRTSTGVRFERDLHARLVAAADERHVAVNFLVNRAVEEFLDRIIPVDEMQWTRPPETTTTSSEAHVYWGVQSMPHSRACGPVAHPHGPRCHENCPTCGGGRLVPRIPPGASLHEQSCGTWSGEGCTCRRSDEGTTDG